MFSKGKTKTLQQLIGEAGLSVPSAVVKEFQSAIDRYQNAKLERAQACAAIAENEAQIERFEESFGALKRRLAEEMASAAKASGDVAAELRSARDAHDLADVAAAGLRVRAQRADEDFNQSIAAVIDAHHKLKFALTGAVRELLIEKASPFAATVRRCIALSASLKIGLAGFYQYRITDPEISSRDLEVDPKLINPFDWNRDGDAVAISSGLDQFASVIFEAQQEANHADQRRAELRDSENHELTRRSQRANEARFGTAVTHGPGGGFLGDAA